ncbi:hypothetical protein [Streptomyces sp. Ac-502]|uniref:hypothetical protein n=1 Tax=Streptomyces sp. Ac-502 TaxID=3342801 RepID=UPI003862435A
MRGEGQRQLVRVDGQIELRVERTRQPAQQRQRRHGAAPSIRSTSSSPSPARRASSLTDIPSAPRTSNTACPSAIAARAST